MREVLIAAGPKATIVESPIPRAKPGQIVIKTVVAGANPKDWKYPERFGTNANQGEDIAGVVHDLGKGVVEFKVSSSPRGGKTGADSIGRRSSGGFA